MWGFFLEKTTCEKTLHNIPLSLQPNINGMIKEITFCKRNKQQSLALDLVAKTNTCVFITGKAGTGKSSFVKWIRDEIKKDILVLAPTGIAAINVEGQTIHSFFNFPLDIIGPHTNLYISPAKKMLLEKVDTIIIDEVSMVRCDIVDAMDRWLRTAFQTNMPFGGKQIVFVGDLFQLPPVVRKGSVDAEMLKDLYGEGIPYFYKANVLKRMNLPKIEFTKVYRQTDKSFLKFLNKMRTGNVSEKDLEALNKHVKEDGKDEDFSVTLTTINQRAEHINEKKLEAIKSEEYCYDAFIDGLFKKGDSPVPERLKLKVGAQVIFCRNDFYNGYANGSIAKVVGLAEDNIVVSLENGKIINVERATWESYERVYNRKTRKIESEMTGSYTQYPLKLAWAITIHKSQGMTFDRMHLDLKRGLFAYGQAYVAISRMRSLDGLTLSNAIKPCHITPNPEIQALANSFNDNAMISDELKIGELIYKYLKDKNYDMAAKTCLNSVISKMKQNDNRNAALMAKKMFDVMLDDKSLLGFTSDIPLLKECSMTCNFLNSVICLYGNRYNEAIGYADMVLDRRQCMEAMFVKCRALYEMKEYSKAYDVCYLMNISVEKSEGNKTIDQKLYLLEAKINEKIGNPNLAICKELIKIAPCFIPSYVMLRKEAIKKQITLICDAETDSELLLTFNDFKISNDIFCHLLNKTDKHSEPFLILRRAIKNLSVS